MPVLDSIAEEYSQHVDVIAIAWASTYEKTAAAAAQLLPSGVTRWTLDEDDSVFAAFGFAYQPAAVLATGGVEVQRWFGGPPTDELRLALDSVIG